MNKTFYLLLSLGLLTGCVTMQAKTVKQKIKKVDFSHEISKEDAATIAKNYVLTHKIPVYTLSRSAERSTFYMASGQVIDVWKILFTQKKLKDFFLPVSYEVDVNMENGGIVHSEQWN